MLKNELLFNGCRMEVESPVRLTSFPKGEMEEAWHLCRTCNVQPELKYSKVILMKAH